MIKRAKIVKKPGFPHISAVKPLYFTIMAFGLFYSGSVAAQVTGVFADNSCDPKYYESLEARAMLEAQREITQNQNLIFKPDSVLEYTCYDNYLDVLAKEAKNMFSESSRWGAPPTNMATALTNVVAQPMNAYDTSNFNHNLLGGRGKNSATLTNSVSAGSYSCDVMNKVWEEAKCMDFIEDPESDGFFTFADYAAGPDKRKFPTACGGSTFKFQEKIDTALVADKTPWEEDKIQTYFDLVYPKSGCGPGASKIPTGLLVERSVGDPTKYEEHICVVPGCYYDAGSKTCTQ